jgi:glutathione S-transferase
MNASPFSSRVRMAIYAKSLPIQIFDPPKGGTASPEYLAINPMGKVPTLVLDDGSVIPESETILEYLADAFPIVKLRPYKAEDAARGRLLSRVADVYIMAACGPLFQQLDPAHRDAAVVSQVLATLDKGIGHLDTFMTNDEYAVGSAITSADCTLVPVLVILGVLGPAFGKGDLLAGHGKVAAYWARVQKNPAAARVIGEMRQAFEVIMKARAAQPA